MNLSIEFVVITVFAVLVCAVVAAIVYRRVPKKLKPIKFETRWKELQAYCKDESTWPEAVITADKLLDEALRRRKFRGSNMGGRIVSAQKQFSDHEAVWRAHNLRKKLESDPNVRLKESDVKDALIGLRQALRDLGALPNDKGQKSSGK